MYKTPRYPRCSRAKGNSVVVIEHNLDIIANADAIIDIMDQMEAINEEILSMLDREKTLLTVEESFTAQALRKYLAHKSLQSKNIH